MGQDAGIFRNAHVPFTGGRNEATLKAKQVSGVRRALDKSPRLGLFGLIYHRIP